MPEPTNRLTETGTEMSRQTSCIAARARDPIASAGKVFPTKAGEAISRKTETGNALPNRARLTGSITGLITTLALLVVTGCGSTTLIGETPTDISGPLGSDESVVLLRANVRATSRTENDFVDCVAKSLDSEKYAVAVIPEQLFVDALYPHFEISSMPTEVQALRLLQQNPLTAEKLTELGVRYIVWMHGNTENVASSGSMSCAVGPGGGGCFGLVSWTNRGGYKADFWDLRRLAEVGAVDLESSGTSYIAGLIVPIPWLARVKSNACDAMAALIAESLS